MFDKISSKPNYRRFGFLPRNSRLFNLYCTIFGHPNLIKRLQAQDIMRMVDVQGEDRVLDFGCGLGMFTVELAKLAKSAHGIDIDPIVETLMIPSKLEGKLAFLRADGRALPFDSGQFDKIFASEIIGFIADSGLFFEEFKRVLAPNGALIICNGKGHPAIEAAFKCGHVIPLLRRIFGSRVPETVDDYYFSISNYFGNETCGFLSLDRINELAERHGFEVEKVDHSPKQPVGAYISWYQFLGYILLGRPPIKFGFLFHYPILSLVNRISRKGYPGGLLIRLRKRVAK